jgi:hypothetical protein
VEVEVDHIQDIHIPDIVAQPVAPIVTLIDLPTTEEALQLIVLIQELKN